MKFLIVGLGNIGLEYEETRHNIGFMVLDHLAEKLKGNFELDRHAHTTTVRHRGRQLILVKPTTYMNLSGKAVRFHMEKNHIPFDKVLIITDDIALPFGKLRLRGKGSDGGHNGLKNINQLLQTQTYPRLKFGIGNDFPKGQQVRYVLEPFTSDERAELMTYIERASDMILSFAAIGLSRTMTEFNGK